MRSHRGITALTLLATGVLAGCGGPDNATSTATDADTNGSSITTDDLTRESTTEDPMGTVEPDASESGPTSTNPAPEPIVGGSPLIELVAPGAVVTEVAPEFAWSPVEGAVEYRLVVLGEHEPMWAWQGAATSIRLGALTEGAGRAFPAPQLPNGTSWSVAALDATGNIVALSDRRPISRP